MSLNIYIHITRVTFVGGVTFVGEVTFVGASGAYATKGRAYATNGVGIYHNTGGPKNILAHQIQ